MFRVVLRQWRHPFISALTNFLAKDSDPAILSVRRKRTCQHQIIVQNIYECHLYVCVMLCSQQTALVGEVEEAMRGSPLVWIWHSPAYLGMRWLRFYIVWDGFGGMPPFSIFGAFTPRSILTHLTWKGFGSKVTQLPIFAGCEPQPWSPKNNKYAQEEISEEIGPWLKKGCLKSPIG